MIEIILSNWLIILSVILLLVILIKFARGYKKDYKDLMKEGAIIVDVRTEAEYKEGHIQNSINVPLKDLTYRISEFDKKDNIVTVCAMGIRAESAKKYFESKGYNVANAGKWSNLKDYT